VADILAIWASLELPPAKRKIRKARKTKKKTAGYSSTCFDAIVLSGKGNFMRSNDGKLGELEKKEKQEKQRSKQ
jgi:hypothetical protein